MLLYNISFYVSWLLLLAPITLLVRSWGRLGLVWKWFAAILISSFLSDLLAEMLWRWHVKTIPNLALNTHTLISLPITIAFIYHAFNWSRHRVRLVATTSIYIAFALCNLAFIQGSGINSYTETLRSFILIFFALRFFLITIRQPQTGKITENPLFWVFAGWFIAFSVRLVIYTATQYLLGMKDNLLYVWTAHNFISTIGNGFSAYAAWLVIRQISEEHDGGQ